MWRELAKEIKKRYRVRGLGESIFLQKRGDPSPQGYRAVPIIPTFPLKGKKRLPDRQSPSLQATERLTKWTHQLSTAISMSLGIKKECPSLGLGAWRGRLREGQPAAQALSR